MCLILLAYRVHPHYELVMAANRDEFYRRPTVPAGFWEDVPWLLAGRDLQEGGTWMGVTRQGRYAAVTNYRDPRAIRPQAPSRGRLVGDYLKGNESARDYLARLVPQAADYNGFNLLLGDARGLFYYSNQDGPPQSLPPGIYGLSNHLLDTPWPKVARGRQALETVLNQSFEPAPEALFAILEDRTQACDEELPDTGVGIERERMLSPMFIQTPDYGTCSSSVLLIEKNGGVYLAEKTHADGRVREFQWERSEETIR